MKTVWKIVLGVGTLGIAVALVVVGQRMIGWFGVTLMLLGVAVLLSLLWGYNRQFR